MTYLITPPIAYWWGKGGTVTGTGTCTWSYLCISHSHPPFLILDATLELVCFWIEVNWELYSEKETRYIRDRRKKDRREEKRKGQNKTDHYRLPIPILLLPPPPPPPSWQQQPTTNSKDGWVWTKTRPKAKWSGKNSPKSRRGKRQTSTFKSRTAEFAEVTFIRCDPVGDRLLIREFFNFTFWLA